MSNTDNRSTQQIFKEALMALNVIAQKDTKSIGKSLRKNKRRKNEKR